MAVFILLLLISVILLSLWWYIKIYFYSRSLIGIPGFSAIPIIGNAFYVSSEKYIIPLFNEIKKYCNGAFTVVFGYKIRLIIFKPDIVEVVLASTTMLKKSYEYHFFHSWLGTGLLTSWNPKWKRQRKLITPTFHFQILESFIEIFNHQTDILIRKLSRKLDQGAFDIVPYITLCTLDIICEAAMGTQVKAQEHSNSEYVKSVKEMCRIIFDRLFSSIKMWDCLYIFSRDYYKEKRALNVLHGYTNSVIKKRRQELLNNSNRHQTKTDDVGRKKRLAFLDLLLQCQIDNQPLSNEVIREEVDTFMFEGHDTTTSAISFTLYLLSKHPEVQERALEELKHIFANDKNRQATYQDLQDMKYLEMVIKESLRLYPPVPLFSRVLEEDVEYGGCILNKGLAITVFSYGLHRLPDIYTDPDKFNPNRFSSENTVGRLPFAYIPFSAGPRNCIGQRFALLEIKSTVSKVLRNFELLPDPEHEPLLSVAAILKSSNGLYMKLKRRMLSL